MNMTSLPRIQVNERIIGGENIANLLRGWTGRSIFVARQGGKRIKSTASAAVNCVLVKCQRRCKECDDQADATMWLRSQSIAHSLRNMHTIMSIVREILTSKKIASGYMIRFSAQWAKNNWRNFSFSPHMYHIIGFNSTFRMMEIIALFFQCGQILFVE